MKKKLLLVSTLVAALSAGAVYAERSGDQGCDYGFKKWGGGMMGFKHNPKEMMDRELTKDQVRTLVEAKLIMKGNENVKVGKVASNRDGFKVDIVTRDDSLVKELELAKNGMPLKMFEHIQERIDKRN